MENPAAGSKRLNSKKKPYVPEATIIVSLINGSERAGKLLLHRCDSGNIELIYYKNCSLAINLGKILFKKLRGAFAGECSLAEYAMKVNEIIQKKMSSKIKDIENTNVFEVYGKHIELLKKWMGELPPRCSVIT